MSEKFEVVKRYYQDRLWTENQVRNAVGKWISKKEFELITGKEY